MRLAPVDRHVSRGRALERGVQARQRTLGVLQVHVRVVERAAVVRTQEEEANHFGVELREDVPQSEEVAKRLGHLLVVDANEPVMHPGVHEAPAAGALGLRDLVLVVGELQVLPAPVDIESLAQQRATHRRAFDMPSRPAPSPRRVPLHLLGLGRLGGFPQHEVERVGLAGVDLHPFAGAQLVKRLAREPAVALELPDRVVHVAVVHLVGEAVLLEPADQVEHLGHILRRPGLMVGLLHAEPLQVLVHRADEPARQLTDGLAVFDRATDDLVVDVRDVAHVGDIQPTGEQPAAHHVENDHHAAVPKVAIVVHCDAADIHADCAGPKGDELLLLSGEGVMDSQHVGGSEGGNLPEKRRSKRWFGA